MTDHRLLEIVDTWFSDPKSINEGAYLEICNLLKKNFDSNPDKLKEELEEEKEDKQELLDDYNELMEDRNKVMDDYNKLMDDRNKLMGEYNSCDTRNDILRDMIYATDKSEDSNKKFKNCSMSMTTAHGNATYNEYLEKFRSRHPLHRFWYPVIINFGFTVQTPTNETSIRHTEKDVVWNDIFLLPCYSFHTRAAGFGCSCFGTPSGTDGLRNCTASKSFSHSYMGKTQTWLEPPNPCVTVLEEQYPPGTDKDLYYNEWHALNRHMNCEDNVLSLLFG